MRIFFVSQSTQLVDLKAAYKSSAPEQCCDGSVVSVFLASATHRGTVPSEEFPSPYFRGRDIIQGTCGSWRYVENSPDIETLQCHGCFFFLGFFSFSLPGRCWTPGQSGSPHVTVEVAVSKI